MAHHKKGKVSRNARAGCKMCKAWKLHGMCRGNEQFEKFSDYKRRKVAKLAVDEFCRKVFD